MSIATAITTAKTRIASAYTTLKNKTAYHTSAETAANLSSWINSLMVIMPSTSALAPDTNKRYIAVGKAISINSISTYNIEVYEDTDPTSANGVQGSLYTTIRWNDTASFNKFAPYFTHFRDNVVRGWIINLSLSVEFTSLKTMGNNCFYDIKNSISSILNLFPTLTTMGDNCFSTITGTITFTFVAFSSLKTMGDNCFYDIKGAISMTSTSLFPALTTMGTGCFHRVLFAYSLLFPVLTTIGQGCFREFRSSITIGVTFGAFIISTGNLDFLSLSPNSISNYTLTLKFEAVQTLQNGIVLNMLENRIATTSTGATTTALHIKTGSAGSPNASTKSWAGMYFSSVTLI